MDCAMPDEVKSLTTVVEKVFKRKDHLIEDKFTEEVDKVLVPRGSVEHIAPKVSIFDTGVSKNGVQNYEVVVDILKTNHEDVAKAMVPVVERMFTSCRCIIQNAFARSLQGRLVNGMRVKLDVFETIVCKHNNDGPTIKIKIAEIGYETDIGRSVPA